MKSGGDCEPGCGVGIIDSTGDCRATCCYRVPPILPIDSAIGSERDVRRGAAGIPGSARRSRKRIDKEPFIEGDHFNGKITVDPAAVAARAECAGSID